VTDERSPIQLAQRRDTASSRGIGSEGRTWQQASVSDEYLVGFVTRSWGTDVANQTPAVIEMQRRLMVEIKKFNRASTVLGWHRDLRGLSAARSRRVSVVDRVHAWEI